MGLRLSGSVESSPLRLRTGTRIERFCDGGRTPSLIYRLQRTVKNGSIDHRQTLEAERSVEGQVRRILVVMPEWCIAAQHWWQHSLLIHVVCSLKHRCKKTLTPRTKNVKKRVFYEKNKKLKKRWIKNVVDKLTSHKPNEKKIPQ